MKKMVFFLIFFISSAFFLPIFSPSPLSAQKARGAQTSAPPDCLEYERPVQLTGNLIRKTFPGPPNFESVKQGDTPEVAWILHLDKPVCVKARPGDDFDVAISRLQDLQLVLGNDHDYQRSRKFLARKVIVTGVLFGAHTGHHHTPALLDVKDIRLMVDKY